MLMPKDQIAMARARSRRSLSRLPFCLALLLFLPGVPPAQAQVWTLGPDPILSLGGLSEDPDYILSEVVGGLRLNDGRIILAERFTNGLRVYDAEGVFIGDIGGPGEGPGEYEYIRGLDRCAGAPVVAFDLHWDMKRYDENLQLLDERSSLLPGIGGTPYFFDCGPSGHWFATGWGNREAHFQAGYFVATAPVVLGMGDSILVDFGERLSSERIGTARDDGTPTGSGPHPFGRRTSLAIGPNRVYMGDGSDFRIERFDLRGDSLPWVEWDGPNLEITREHLDIYGSVRLETVSSAQKPALRRWLKALSEVERFPAYDALRVDPVGNLWVRYFRKPGEADSRWVVLNEAGNLIGEVRLPGSTKLLDIGSDYLLVVEKDDLDVESVLLFRLDRSGAGR